MAKNAKSPALKDAFTTHREETALQVERLEEVFKRLGKSAKALPCEVIKGLIEEAEEVISESNPGSVRDAGLIACGQAVEHYEIARYTSLIAWATAIGLKDVLPLLQQTLGEETKAEKGLADLATKDINKAAAKMTKAA